MANRGHLYIYIKIYIYMNSEWYERERLQRPREGCPQIGHTFQFYLSHAVLGDVVVYIRVKKLWTLYINKTAYSRSIASLWRDCSFERRPPCSKQATGFRSTAIKTASYGRCSGRTRSHKVPTYNVFIYEIIYLNCSSIFHVDSGSILLFYPPKIQNLYWLAHTSRIVFKYITTQSVCIWVFSIYIYISVLRMNI
jgi:hypothetical protein